MELQTVVKSSVERNDMNSIKIAAGWRIVVEDEEKFMRLIPKLRKYNIHGIYTWTYDIHP